LLPPSSSDLRDDGVINMRIGDDYASATVSKTDSDRR
jgi:hypothetical protein